MEIIGLILSSLGILMAITVIGEAILTQVKKGFNRLFEYIRDYFNKK